MATTQEITFRDAPSRIAAADAQRGAAAPELQNQPGDMEGEKMVLNMGPSHPSTHGVLRIVLEMDGEIIFSPSMSPG